MNWIATHIPPWFWIALVAHNVIMGTVAYLILHERKIAAWTQDRVGPNRVGPLGLLQPLADGLKMFLKEDYRPAGTDPILFSIAPTVMILVMVVSIAVLPWGGTKQSTRTFEIRNAEDPVAAAVAQIPPGSTVVGQPTVQTVGEDEGAKSLVTV